MNLIWIQWLEIAILAAWLIYIEVFEIRPIRESLRELWEENQKNKSVYLQQQNSIYSLESRWRLLKQDKQRNKKTP